MFLSLKDIQIIEGVTVSTASRRIQKVKEVLGVSRKKITLEEYAEYIGVDIEQIRERLKI